ncbi:hypothetical protein CERSUDRAFT_95480 [Gelatoporia subvermispora B]|uniref:U6 small nuclear RNA (adenine-(43)-N(6))-methyltransferase n=1 Tax=Ceriporiopsis subvermispora (strain B) TaxID=914234 RepID=M2QYJ0_CERS8|nr:hypothetical protein CERSUDRAFT_95480 [Gelatoporia subvermispora B]
MPAASIQLSPAVSSVYSPPPEEPLLTIRMTPHNGLPTVREILARNMQLRLALVQEIDGSFAPAGLQHQVDVAHRPTVPSAKVPNRLNYILWLEDVVKTVRLAEPDAFRNGVQGLDIGTGASAIYPLLGCRTDPTWTFTATDIDSKSFQFARSNIATNGLDDRIRVVQSDPTGAILAPLMENNLELQVSEEIGDEAVRYDFTMCNPPFYSSREDIAQSAETKEYGPNAQICTGAEVEMITAGGEMTFVCQMVRESSKSRCRCRWYTSMLGKMSTLMEVVALLRELNIDNYACTELVQGQTRRWVVAWSFGDIRLPDALESKSAKRNARTELAMA